MVQYSYQRYGLASMMGLGLLLMNSIASAATIDLRDFYADPSVTVAADGKSAVLEEDDNLNFVLLSNDPGLGDEEIIKPRPNLVFSFDYNFVEGQGDDDEFGVFFMDPMTGESIGDAYAFFTQASNAGRLSFSLPELAGETLGLQFQLTSLLADTAATSKVTIANLNLQEVPLPASLLLLCSGLFAFATTAIKAKRRRLKRLIERLSRVGTKFRNPKSIAIALTMGVMTLCPGLSNAQVPPSKLESAPADLISIQLSGGKFNRRSKHARYKLTITNNSDAEMLEGPFYLAIKNIVPNSVTLTNADEHDQNGDPLLFIDLKNLLPGAQHTIPVSFQNLQRARFNFATQLYTINKTVDFHPAKAILGSGDLLRYTLSDLNGDGIKDLIQTQGVLSDFRVSVSLGQPDGSMQFLRSYTVGPHPVAFVIEDFNADGVKDLAVAISLEGHLALFLGNGDGDFQEPVQYTVNGQPSMLSISDFNQDDVPDLLVTDIQQKLSTMLIGNGDGSFTSLASVTPHGQHEVMDLNQDGLLDLLGFRAFEGEIETCLGNGDGTFQNPQAVASSIAWTQATDLNNDEIIDLLTIEKSTRNATALLGNGLGAFITPRTIAEQVKGILLADFNHDGLQDLVVIKTISIPFTRDQERVEVLIGIGNAEFAAPTTIADGLGDIDIADINRDGNQDIIATNRLFLGNGDGTFATGVDIAQPLHAISSVDLNADRILDLITYIDNRVVILVGRGDGTFHVPQEFSVGIEFMDEIQFVSVDDVNGDGNHDLVVFHRFIAARSSDSVSVLIGK